jgi:hypothetical protein
MNYNGDTPEDILANVTFTQMRIDEGGAFDPRQVEQIAADYFQGGWETAATYWKWSLEHELSALRRERDLALAAARHEAGEVNHWRKNHADQVARCALLRQREDLPVDRIPAYAELARLQQTHAARIERDRELRVKLMQADAGACTCMTKTPEPACHADTCRHRLLMEALMLLDQP